MMTMIIDNKQNKSKIDAPKNIKLPPTFRATCTVG